MPRADKLLLLDTASLYFRAFYGVPDKVTAPDGSPINAVRGLLDIVAKLITLFPDAVHVTCEQRVELTRQYGVAIGIREQRDKLRDTALDQVDTGRLERLEEPR